MIPSSAQRNEYRLDAVEGYLLLEMGDEALREVDAVRTGGGDALRVCRLRAEALRLLKRHLEALAEFEAVDRRDPDDLGTLMGMAWCLKRIDRLNDAIEVMQRAYHTHPDDPLVLYNIACYYSLAGDKPQALSWLGRALRKQPKLRSLIPEETDFAPLRDDPDFQFIISDPTTADESH